MPISFGRTALTASGLRQTTNHTTAWSTLMLQGQSTMTRTLKARHYCTLTHESRIQCRLLGKTFSAIAITVCCISKWRIRLPFLQATADLLRDVGSLQPSWLVCSRTRCRRNHLHKKYDTKGTPS